MPDGHPATTTSARVFTADRGDAGRRLDLVLRRNLVDVKAATRTRIQKLIDGGHVTVNGVVVRRTAARAAHGDVVSVMLPATALRRAMAAEDVTLEVLYQDPDILAINKPAGLVVHPTRAHATGTLMNALLGLAREWPSPQRPSLVGRLDRLTSGIVLIAKSAASHAALQRAMASPQTDKTYLSLVYGRAERHGVIDRSIHDDGTARRRVDSSGGRGVSSVTWFERLDHVAASPVGLSLLRCRLRTGRTHQIRAHLAAMGWPIVGDPLYGEPRWSEVRDPDLAQALAALPRQALHAWRLELIHPFSGARLHIEAPVPADIGRLLAAAGLSVDSPSP